MKELSFHKIYQRLLEGFYKKTYISDFDISCQKPLLEKQEVDGTELERCQKPPISRFSKNVITPLLEEN